MSFFRHMLGGGFKFYLVICLLDYTSHSSFVLFRRCFFPQSDIGDGWDEAWDTVVD